MKNLKAKKDELKLEASNLVEERSEAISTEDLQRLKAIKEEITQIDDSIKAIEDTRSMTQAQAVKVETREPEAELRANFNEFLRGTISMKEAETRALAVGSPTKGGNIVPDEFLKELQKKILEFGQISGKVKHITTADHGELTIPMIDNTKEQGVWVDEAGKLDLKDISTDTMTMNAYKIGTGIQVSTEILEDSFFDLAGFIASALAERIARSQEAAFMNGDGAKKPLGIVADPKTIKVTTKKAAALDVNDLLGMIHKLNPSQRNGAEFLVSDAVLEMMLLSVDANGRPLLQASSAASQKDGVQYTLGGYNVSANYELGAIATGETVALFGNLSNYLVRDVRGVTLKRDDYTSMDTDQVNFYVTARLDGKVVSNNVPFAKLEVK